MAPKRNYDTPRFKTGQHVLCKTGRVEWEAGTIVKLHWVDPWEGAVHPYQVSLWSDSRLIYVPFDDDQCCKKLERAWWEEIMERDDISDETGVNMILELSKGKDLDARSYQEETALLTAMACKWEPGVKTLLELRADPNAAGKNSMRPLHLAVQLGEDCVRQILSARADPNLQNKDPNKDPDFDSKSFEEREWHRTALHYASSSPRDVLTMSMLLLSRADPNVPDAQCMTPLHVAIEAQNLKGLQLLIQASADVNVGNYSMGMKTSPLIDAAYHNDLQTMRELISARADLDKKGKQDMTALHVAARGRHSEAVKLLVEARADFTIRAMGKTPGELAAKNGMLDAASLLGCGYAADIEQKENSTNIVMDAKMRALLHMD
eukprot:TRINITY_DN61074_c0_g1_i1.p1 TRINITY_DN61074_c0_g1~~TRINITY_DN61074_c0_g1_i1.p1  ORF type:complete len:378 (-),score=76.21 TRINITY_DN61074_c0_g1_i1:450-1583(-)